MSGIVIPPTLFFFLKITEAIWGHLWFQYKFLKYLLYVKYVIGMLIVTALNLYIALGSMSIFMRLILPIHEHGICFHLFVFSLISFFSVL